MRNTQLLLIDIHEAISEIERFVEGVNFEDFIKNDEKTSAVIRNFEIIGEAVKGLPEDLKAKYNEISWKDMTAFRDKLIHFYFGIKYELV